MLTANRGLCGGYNASVLRLANARFQELQQRRARRCGWKCPASAASRPSASAASSPTSVHAFRGQARFRRGRRAGQPLSGRFHGRPARPARRGLHEVRERQPAAGGGRDAAAARRSWKAADEEERRSAEPQYEFLPSAESILDEVVPTSFKVKLFKCFLDAAVSEQIARMVAMKAATENADAMIAQPVDGLQPRPARTDHRRVAGDHRRGGSAERSKKDCKLKIANCKLQIEQVNRNMQIYWGIDDTG